MNIIIVIAVNFLLWCDGAGNSWNETVGEIEAGDRDGDMIWEDRLAYGFLVTIPAIIDVLGLAHGDGGIKETVVCSGEG